MIVDLRETLVIGGCQGQMEIQANLAPRVPSDNLVTKGSRARPEMLDKQGLRDQEDQMVPQGNPVTADSRDQPDRLGPLGQWEK